jgi:anti-anti-sigma regulatory factor
VNTVWNMDAIRGEIERQPTPPRVVVLDLGASPDLDVAGVDFLANLHRDLAHDNRELWITHAQPKVAALIAGAELRDVIAQDQVWPTNRDALQAFRHRSQPVHS